MEKSRESRRMLRNRSSFSEKGSRVNVLLFYTLDAA
jgi:hypothetical protein